MPRTLTVSFVEFFDGAVLCMALFEELNMIRRALPCGLLGQHKSTSECALSCKVYTPSILVS